MTTYSFPDAEVVLVAYLKTLSAGFPAGTIVSTEVPNDYNGTQYVVRLDRCGGPTNWPYADHPCVEVSCFGPDKLSAAGLRDTVRSALTWMALAAFDFSTLGARVSDANEKLGPQWFAEDGYPPAGSWKFEVSMDLRSG